MSAFVNTSFAQDAAQIRPSLQVCPVPTLTEHFVPGKVDCVTPLEQVVKLEEKHILQPHKKADIPQQPKVALTPYFSASDTAASPPQSSQNLSTDTIFNLINEYRSRAGLASFQKDANLCSIAASRAPQMPGEIANGTLHSGLYNRNLPYWITENMKYGGNEVDTVNWWLNSPIHHAAIVSNARYACGTCVRNMCDMLFTSYVPKS